MCCPYIPSVVELGEILKFMALSHKTKNYVAWQTFMLKTLAKQINYRS